ncbi:MAG: hypothetical protein HYZ14_13110 [Bacteroidetes bacterium]|nr:hypothetical protein [Bacteroidota bacterium]
MILLDLGSAIGRAASDIELKTTVFFGVVIFLQLIFILVGLVRRKAGYQAFLRYYGIVPLAFSVLCFQHEVGHYIQGTTMLLLTVISVLLSFRSTVD